MTQHLYERILGEDWPALPDTTRFLHAPTPVCELVGAADIQRGDNYIARLLAEMMRLPKSGQQVPTRVRVTAEAGGEWLERWYGGQRFATWQWTKGNRLLENSVHLPSSSRCRGMRPEFSLYWSAYSYGQSLCPA